MNIGSFGSWASPITSDLIVAQSIGISGIRILGDNLYWLESRPQEAGRSVVVERCTDGSQRDINSAPYNIRSSVHEYGGDAWLLHEESLYFVNFADQQVYRQSLAGEDPVSLTNIPGLRFANGVMDAARHRLIYVIEDHRNDGEAQNYLGAVDLESGAVTVIASGHDFYSSPTLNPAGDQLAFITWDHPDMPWDETVLWHAEVNGDGTITSPVQIDGGKKRRRKLSLQQPRYSPDGKLYYLSDETGWWNLFTQGNCCCDRPAEFGRAHWNFGLSTYQFLDAATIVCVFSEKGISHLATLNLRSGHLKIIEQPFTDIGSLHLTARQLTYTAASPTAFTSAVVHDLDTGKQQIVKQTMTLDLDEGYISIPQTIEYSSGNDTTHAFFYAPKNRDFNGPPADKPPLLVFMHGGPTSATHNALSLSTQFWTSRGFAILDINYRGSTGYGREYRDKLLQQWGIVDVEDTVSGANYLADNNLVDVNRLAIRGGSAGGFTTLAALTFKDTFSAGASHYGIGDLEALARDTHKFESRYLDSLVGDYPAAIDRYRARSPIHHAEKLNTAVIFFQGLEDRIVPPNQAEAMVSVLEGKGLPVAYVPFAGEQHGFRLAANIKRALDLELYFYARIFGFTPADAIEPVAISNLD